MKKDLKLLVIDDDFEIAEVIKTHLTWKGYNHIQVAKSGKEALELFSADRFDIVFTDVRMPEMTGVDLLKKIKNIRGETVVIMITGNSNLSDVVQCQALGALDFIFKPFGNFSEIDAVMERAQELLNRWIGIKNKVKGIDIF